MRLIISGYELKKSFKVFLKIFENIKISHINIKEYLLLDI